MSVWFRFLAAQILRAPDGDPPSGAGGDPGAGSGPGAGGGDPPPASFLASLPEDLRGHDGLKRFEKGGAAELARSWVDAQTMIGRYQQSNLVMPGKDAKPEEWNPIYQKLGWPEKPDAYKLPEVEGRPYTEADKAFQAEVLPKLHGMRLTQDQVAGVVGLWNGMQTQMIEAATTALAGSQAELKKTWGEKYDTNVDLAMRGLHEVIGRSGIDAEQLKHLRFADGSYAADNPMFVRMFHQIGEMLKESGYNGSSPGAGNRGGGDGFASPAAAKAELDRLYASDFQKKDHPYNNSRDPLHQSWRDRVMKLQELAGKRAQ